ncbi:MAG: hypothetical protein WD045_04980 [Pirellulaceae bacterium]
MAEQKIAHLQMIQGVIDRLANASFVVRGWAVTLVAAVFALSGRDAERLFFLIAYIPTVIFWILDGYYLSRERAFRQLYDEVRVKDETSVDFGMATTRSSESWAGSCFSLPVLLFYGVLAVAILVVMFALPKGNA